MSICEYVWVGFFVLWMLWAIRTKPVKIKEGTRSGLSHRILTIAAYALIFTPVASRGWMGIRVFPINLPIEALGISITAMGITFAIWARAYLGGNWSSSVTVKVGHELVRTGPYCWVRHPIYTGLILALLGTAMVDGRRRGIIAVILLYAGFKIKSLVEERAMTSTFGAEYDDYRHNTGAIFPKLVH